MTRPARLRIVAVGACFLGLLLSASDISAQSTSRDWDPDTTKGRTKVKVNVESRPHGIDLQMSVQRTVPRDRDRDDRPNDVKTRSEEPARPAWSPPAVASGDSGVASYVPVAPQRRTWTEGNTIHEVTPEGQHTVLVPVYAPVWTSDGLTLTRQQLRQYPNEGGYTAIVDGQIQGVVWRPLPDPNVAQQPIPLLPADQRPGGGGGLDPLSVALDIEAHIPLPDIRVRTNPGLGLVALPSWYWVEGYRGERFGESRTITLPPANPLDPNDRGVSFTVEVSVWGDRYDWSFGDGKGASTRSLGKPYPQESDIQHVYQHSSLPFANGFPVRLTVEFAAEFRVNGAGPFGLPPIRRTYEAAHRVQEIQPVLITR